MPVLINTDIDECVGENPPCHDDATCTDNDGSYTCACNSGYLGDGTTTCAGKYHFNHEV